eukprot:gb/GEZN01007894.1/.p1 GENE.gb/GEZN01007894.1/~~gb/GEZN01007894.1/.p1  ORF type:complete len:436 (-),score=33.58 gb/GEZN01007894.1/:82-1389(-)
MQRLSMDPSIAPRQSLSKRHSLAEVFALPRGTMPADNASTIDSFFASLSSISKHLSARKVGKRIIKHTCKMLGAQRATLYYIDGGDLTIMVAKGTSNVAFSLPLGSSIPGWVAEHNEVARVSCASEDPRHDPRYDIETKFHTRNICAAPITNPEGQVIAVLEALNKQPHTDEGFDSRDEILLENLAFHAGIVLRNAQLYESAKLSENKVTFLFSLVEALQSADSVNAVLHAVATRANMLVNADRCTLYLVDRARSQLIVMQESMELRIPMSKGIAGHVAREGEIVNIPDCYKDARFNQAVDKKTGYRTRSMLCMPVFGEGQTLGVLQVINKKDAAEFGPADEQSLQKLLTIAGPVIARSPFFGSIIALRPQASAQLASPSRRARSGSRTAARSSRVAARTPRGNVEATPRGKSARISTISPGSLGEIRESGIEED